MTTASVSGPCSQTTNATFEAWVSEVVTALFTTIGVTQTADTGQINPTTVAFPSAANTSQGYVIGRFNDTLQATLPVFFKLEFGSGSGAANPQMWITIGTGSNGSGTITGTVGTRAAVCNGTTAGSVTSFTSRYCYNATYGFLGVCFKIGMTAANCSLGGFYIGRSNNSSGATTGDGVWLLTNSNTATGASSNVGFLQSISFDTSTVYPASLANATGWSFFPNITTTTYSSDCSVLPCIATFPYLQFTMQLAVALNAEVPVGNTYSLAMIGSTALTYLSIGWGWGSTSSFFGAALNTTGLTLCMLWQ